MTSNYEQFLSLMASEHGLSFDSYEALHHFSINEQGTFWQAIASFFEITFTQQPEQLFIEKEQLWQAQYFTKARLSYAGHLIRYANTERPALLFKSEEQHTQAISWGALLTRALAYQRKLLDLGVRPGDRVVALCTNSPETIAAFLATNSLGAIWSSCAVEFGYRALLDRFSSISPKVLFAHRQYTYGSKRFDLEPTLTQLKLNLTSLEEVVTLEPLLEGEPSTETLQTLINAFTLEQVAFDHPVYLLFSSGTTGKPKGILHKTGAMLLEHCKALGIHQGVQKGDRYFWYSTTGWMMWNYSLSSLALGATLCLYDGAPHHPSPAVLWQYAKEVAMNHFGHGAAYFAHLAEHNQPLHAFNVSSIRTVGSTGSALTVKAYHYIQGQLPQAEIHSISGGTDVCTAFVGGLEGRSTKPAEIACKLLGASVEIFDPQGQPLIDEPGELVLTRPFIAFPLGFWGDHEHTQFKQSYFSSFSNVWKHGDWAKETLDHRIIIYGRSDATLNRGGVRIGTAEIYNALSHLDAIEDALVIHLFTAEFDQLLLFVVSRSTVNAATITSHLQRECSPRHKPDHVIQVAAIPYTLNGKKVEIPVKRILEGAPIEQVISLASVKNPESLYAFEALRPQLFSLFHSST